MESRDGAPFVPIAERVRDGNFGMSDFGGLPERERYSRFCILPGVSGLTGGSSTTVVRTLNRPPFPAAKQLGTTNGKYRNRPASSSPT